MAIFNFSDLSKQSKIGYNALYNVILSHSTTFNPKTGLNKFTVPLCLNADKKVSLTEKFERGGELLDIQVLDHIIIGKYDYYSFLEHDNMNQEEKSVKVAEL